MPKGSAFCAALCNFVMHDVKNQVLSIVEQHLALLEVYKKYINDSMFGLFIAVEMRMRLIR